MINIENHFKNSGHASKVIIDRKRQIGIFKKLQCSIITRKIKINFFIKLWQNEELFAHFDDYTRKLTSCYKFKMQNHTHSILQ